MKSKGGYSDVPVEINIIRTQTTESYGEDKLACQNGLERNSTDET